MTKMILFIFVTILLSITVEHCQAIHDNTDSSENEMKITQLKANSRLLQQGHYYRRIRRQSEESISSLDTAATVLSILPLDRIGAIVGQIMSTGLKEMFNPEVGKKIVNVLENQGPLLLTSLFSNLFTTLAIPGKIPPKPNPNPNPNPATSSIIKNTNSPIQLSNNSISELVGALRRPPAK
ncbi:unnamed protein product [Rotaria socialis]|uniref:Uncharacterized protein n=2 Tax=Rotaria socialis TaxID=392032 RepID=A0A817YGP8_9BILA|nr:unnamed protein product [Rotaria socialis]CAF3380167.1 unnamed protein product [Rotaria socialis]CAF3425321.1 unnamed protein product [Rotaria socialis]CAF3474106.1 unnamed protein product [Rotaria socialis]CAF4125077.1 unnamed protein product [Rotaria socialis]